MAGGRFIPCAERFDAYFELPAKLNGHDPYRYLKDVLERLPTQSASRIEDLLSHRWQSQHG